MMKAAASEMPAGSERVSKRKCFAPLARKRSARAMYSPAGSAASGEQGPRSPKRQARSPKGSARSQAASSKEKHFSRPMAWGLRPKVLVLMARAPASM